MCRALPRTVSWGPPRSCWSTVVQGCHCAPGVQPQGALWVLFQRPRFRDVRTPWALLRPPSIQFEGCLSKWAWASSVPCRAHPAVERTLLQSVEVMRETQPMQPQGIAVRLPSRLALGEAWVLAWEAGWKGQRCHLLPSFLRQKDHLSCV